METKFCVETVTSILASPRRKDLMLLIDLKNLNIQILIYSVLR